MKMRAASGILNTSIEANKIGGLSVANLKIQLAGFYQMQLKCEFRIKRLTPIEKLFLGKLT